MSLNDSDITFMRGLSLKRAALLDRLKDAFLNSDLRGIIEYGSLLCGLDRPKAVTCTDDGLAIDWNDRHPHKKHNNKNIDHDKNTNKNNVHAIAPGNRSHSRLD